MTKVSVATIPAKLYALLESLSPDERLRTVRATLMLFGADAPADLTSGTGRNLTPTNSPPRTKAGDVAAYFRDKNPQNKGEVLAVAARYREQFASAESHQRSDLQDTITRAHRNFDASHFSRDIENAKRQSGFFVLGSSKDGYRLSYYGKEFVDALPNREAADQLQRPKVRRKKKRTKS